MRPYLQHGRRHGKTGSDPIPNLGDLPCMVGRLPAYSLPSGVVGVIPPLTSWFIGTSDSAIMEPLTGDDAWHIYEAGVYSAVVAVDMIISASPDADTYATVNFNIYDDGLLEGIIQPWANLSQIALGGTAVSNLDAPPTSSGVVIQQNSGHTATVNINLLVVQYSTTTVTLV